jgi:hypothetical protein
VFGSLELGSGERGEIILAPTKALDKPVLFMSCPVGRVAVENIFHGCAALTDPISWSIDMLKMGFKLKVIVTASEPIKIVVVNAGKVPVRVGGSLVAALPTPSKT